MRMHTSDIQRSRRTARLMDRPEQSPAIETSWQPPDWTNDGECLELGYDPEWWFQPANSADTRKAKRLCTACPVLALCRAYALDNRISDGTWGGMSETELRAAHRAADIEAKKIGAMTRTTKRGYDVGKVVPRKQATA
jgi:WhiB family transcriptional regulator, redox-sensing transcriptional regulator